MKMNTCNDKVILSIRNLSKSYNKTGIFANDLINMDIEEGEIFGVLGPNGAGKTTLIRQVVGLLKPDDGDITLFGENIIKNLDVIPEYISYLSQVLYAHKALKVEEFIVFTGLYRGLPLKEAKKQTRMLIHYFGIQGISNRLIEYLSGGELRLVGFLGSIIGFRPLIILDEPTNDMDPEKRILLWQLVKQLKNQRGITFILVTHNVHEAQDVVDRVAIMQNGKIVTQGKPCEIIQNIHALSKVFFELPYDIVLNTTFKYYSRIRKINQEQYFIETTSEEINDILYTILSCELKDEIRNIHIKEPSLEDAYLVEVEKKKENENC